MIDIAFNVNSDARGGDPDSTSPTLRRYHKLLWRKPLPGGSFFDLQENVHGSYLWYSSELGEFSLGSDAITHSYRNQKKKTGITSQIREQVQELYDVGSTIGAYIIFPNKQINRKYTINQARGMERLIDDRFDLTLECIRRFYDGSSNPLESALLRYEAFFKLFADFNGYVDFFLLNDLIADNGEIKFYLPFDNFQTPPSIACIEDYLTYKEGVTDFVKSRGKRMETYASSLSNLTA